MQNNQKEDKNDITKLNLFQKTFRPRYNIYWILAAIAICSILFIYSPSPSIPSYNKGDISKSTIKSPIDLEFVDESATKERREQAEQNVPPVYDYDPLLKNSIIFKLNSLFDEGHKFFQWKENIYANDKKNKSYQQEDINLFIKTIKNSLNIDITEEIAKALVYDNFSKEVQTALSQALEQCIKNKIISDKRIIQFNSKGEFLLRDIASNRENRNPNIKEILSLEEAYSILKDALKEKEAISEKHFNAYYNLLKLLVIPNINFNSQETLNRRILAIENTEPVIIRIKKGKVIVRDGEEINEKQLMQLQAIKKYKSSLQEGKNIFNVGSVIILALFLIWIVSKNHPIHNILLREKNVVLLLCFIYVFNLICLRIFQLLSESVSNSFITSPYNNSAQYFYIFPFAIGALALTILVDSQIALAFGLIFSLSSVLLLSGDLMKFLYILISNISSVFWIKQYRQRSDLIKAGAKIGFVNILAIIYIYLLSSEEIQLNNWIFLMSLGFAGGLFSAILVSIILPIIESIFYLITEFKLMELGNIESPLLKELAIKAPGTYHHSIIVSILAEQASEAIKVNSLFIRVAALYHDIGKMTKPEAFIENQRGVNIHEALTPMESAKYIISHIYEGYNLAKKYKLPKDLVNVIVQHHGQKLVSYFYSKALEKYPPSEVKEEDFRYPGPKPKSKEAAILMIADAVEAASRTIEHAEPDTIRNLVGKIIQDCFEDGQLNESNLSIKELHLIAEAMISILLNMKHGRIDYPGFDFTKSPRQSLSQNDFEHIIKSPTKIFYH